MLYILATPIGNLNDFSDRAKEILQNTNLVIAENPSHSQILINHFGSGKKRMLQFAEHNELAVIPKIMTELEKVDAVLISDAGTPGISDPGFRIVRAAIEKGIQVSPIPGPSAAISALSASGLPTDKFVFLGFVPKTEVKLIRELQSAKDIQATAVFYESPQRILKTLAYVTKAFPEAKVVVAREITKIHEEFLRGSAQHVAGQLAKKPSVKGEITVVISLK